MKKVLLVLLCILGIKVTGQSQTRKVLFLGNSYTYVNDLPQIVSQLATNTGDVLLYDSNLIGGYTLQDHYSSSVSLNKILSNEWDYIVLQEQSQRPSFPIPSAFMNGFLNLKSYIKQNKPCAQITSFMTWGHENGDIQNCPTNPVACTYDGMQSLLTDRYMNTSSLHEAEVTPVGVVWKFIRDNYPSIPLYQSDGSHPSVAGSYLAACCFYTSLFRKDPTLITDNYGLDATTASILRNAVKTLVYNQMQEWYIGKYIPNSNFTYFIGNGTNEIVINTNTSIYQDTYLWDFGDGATSTAALPTHSYATDGTYIIKLTTNKCYLGQNLQSVFERTVNFCPHTNTILPDNLILCPDQTGTLWTQPADAYQWLDYLNNPIIGETNQSIQVSPVGSYSVLTTINGCTEMSPQVFVDGYVVIGPGDDPCSLDTIDFDKDFNVTIFPNPTQSILHIDTNQMIKIISVYDLTGKEVTVNQVSNTTVDVSNLAKGFYVLKITSETDNIKTTKFVKE
jgi:hypothetical protein